MPLRPGDETRLGQYELIGRLGEGGMGTVFQGRDPAGRLVAIKMVRPEFVHESEFRARFRSEVNRAKQVPPFSTAEVLDADPDHEPPYLVVEFVDGPSLAAEVRDNGPLSGAALHSVAVGIATALTAIHGAGVIHRDLKPGNVLFARGGIKVIDFGIARAFEATSQHTRTDQMVGTVAYMAPERFDPAGGRPVTPAADIFAWAAVVAFAATGRTPFAADSAAATAMRILTQPPDLSGVPVPLRPVVERALDKDPEARPTARELLDVLLAGTAPLSPAAPAPVEADTVLVPVVAPRRRSRLLPITAVVVVLLAAAGVALARYLPVDDRSSAAPTVETSVSLVPSPSATPSLTAADKLSSIKLGKRRTLIHIAEADRDLALDVTDEEVQGGDGTGPKSEFALVPVGVQYMIRTLREPDAKRQTCLGVEIVLDESARLVPTTCEPTEATLFNLDPADGTDDKKRPTYYLSNKKYGAVQWSEGDRVLFVEVLGDAPPLSSFSFVDRGPL
ncbi:serine/threonine-protein kinase [Actinoplanes sp. NPDC020271]|uniref:serine/threonine-protein kinase n=1 Tax=Actinoplanes sp. NPDC020271 TaxID=3363896 RepID=UPI003796CA2E